MITKDMTIGDVVAKYPEAAKIMLQHGLHCVGCKISPFETIEQGFLSHGKDPAGLEKMLNEVNAFLASRDSTKGKAAEETTALVSLTPAAAKHVLGLMENEGSKGGLRVNVLPGGCSGFMYSMNFDEAPNGDDVVFESEGVRIFVNSEYVEYLSGTKIDFVNTLNENGFVFDNPNAKHSCGCGKSFR